MTYQNKAGGRAGIEYGGGGFIERRPSAPAPALKTAEDAVVDGDELVGVACRYEVLHQNLKGETELFVRGCFGRTLASNQAVRLLLGHDEGKLVATSADALRLESDDRELRIRCAVPNTATGRSMKQAVRFGGHNQCSVGYLVIESVKREIGGREVKVVCDAQLLEVSLVPTGAVPGTKASIRVATDDPVIKAMNQLLEVMDQKSRALRHLLESL